MREYELTVLVHPDLESKLEEPLKALRELVETNGGKITKEENWGKKRLAYRIEGQDFAIYVSFDLELPADAPLKISNSLNITDFALRYLLVKVDEKERKKLAAAKEKAANSDEPDERQDRDDASRSPTETKN